MLHVLIQQKDVVRNIIRYFATRLYRMSCTTPMTAASNHAAILCTARKCVSAPLMVERGLDQAGERGAAWSGET